MSSDNSQYSGLKKIHPKKKFKNISAGNKHPLLLKNTIGFIKTPAIQKAKKICPLATAPD
jgi:hypothetical protein